MTPTAGQLVDFHTALAASRRSSEIPDSADVYGWLCGSWDLEVLQYRGIDVTDRGMKRGGYHEHDDVRAHDDARRVARAGLE